MQTLRLTHRLDLRLIGISGLSVYLGWRDREADVGVEVRLEVKVGDNFWRSMWNEILGNSKVLDAFIFL